VLAPRISEAWSAKPRKAGIPVVSVGSLTAGGSGKTPVVMWLAAQLQARGIEAWVVGRGYRRQGDKPLLRIGLPTRPPAADLGDELEMMRRRGISVISCPDRVKGAKEAKLQGADVVLLDDGFQHRACHRDLDIVVLDARWPAGRGMIPMGTGREGADALARAHIAWVHHSAPAAPPLPLLAGHEHLTEVRSQSVATGWLHHNKRLPLDAVSGEVDAACAIARPEGFWGTLVARGLQLRSWRRARDHGALGALPAGTLITEKDAARIHPRIDVRALVMDLDVHGGEAVLDRISALVAVP
jgi:tetraacyldisaccharide 4'-kinase